ncbi:cytochrome P450 714C2-like [Tasmannia lanceolata]|uniref:cytochrome P450 714C2-like n=1 Tax=Tasmannia lanceolata TaxID=3420 RepID=UPI004064C425
MEFIQSMQRLSLSVAALLLFSLFTGIFAFWFSAIRANQKLQRNGFRGPPPSFPLGNITEISRKQKKALLQSPPLDISHDFHSTVFPYFVQWRSVYGKVFIYWLGTEPFLYIAEPEFLKKVDSVVVSKTWGKPTVFKRDRKPLFGNGLLMAEGDDWAHNRHIIAPAFSPANLKAMISLMVESTTNMLDEWSRLVASNKTEIDVERFITNNAGEIIAKTSFGMTHQYGQKVFEKLKSMQVMLFKPNRLVGVPFSKFIYAKQTLEIRRLGKEIDRLLLSIIDSRKAHKGEPQHDLLGLLLTMNHANGQLGKKLTARELVDECKTFFFGGYETTALAVSWTLLLLALHPEWQCLLREEIIQVIGEGTMDFTMLTKLEKMGWVMHEVLRLYSPAPNVQRQAREDIQVGDVAIPKGTNMWIDIVGMHHDPELWGDDVNEFQPDRWSKNALYGGCKHRMGFLPFGFGGRMCVGKNLSMMEYKIVLTLILTRFSMSVSSSYTHSPTHMFTLKPSCGIPLIFQHV